VAWRNRMVVKAHLMLQLRSSGQRPLARAMQPYEPFTHTELEYLIDHSTAMEKQPGMGTDLERDREELLKAVYAHAKWYAIVADRRKHVGQKAIASGWASLSE